ncbi:MAG: hypothetical protein IJW15_01055 [Clostridia bacterium]|nr:hypothetical protein [Clostridia bacterium]
MNYYRITKYNPEFRDKEGHYTANSWTSVSDIGKTFGDGILTVAKYKQTEDTYVEAVKIILKEKGISKMTVCGLEKNNDAKEGGFSSKEESFFERVTNNSYVELLEIETAVRLTLREAIWCSLLSDKEDVKIEFGYDYYMYVRCDAVEESTKQKILDMGSFVETV